MNWKFWSKSAPGGEVATKGSKSKKWFVTVAVVLGLAFIVPPTYSRVKNSISQSGKNGTSTISSSATKGTLLSSGTTLLGVVIDKNKDWNTYGLDQANKNPYPVDFVDINMLTISRDQEQVYFKFDLNDKIPENFAKVDAATGDRTFSWRFYLGFDKDDNNDTGANMMKGAEMLFYAVNEGDGMQMYFKDGLDSSGNFTKETKVDKFNGGVGENFLTFALPIGKLDKKAGEYFAIRAISKIDSQKYNDAASQDVLDNPEGDFYGRVKVRLKDEINLATTKSEEKKVDSVPSRDEIVKTTTASAGTSGARKSVGAKVKVASSTPSTPATEGSTNSSSTSSSATNTNTTQTEPTATTSTSSQPTAVATATPAAEETKYDGDELAENPSGYAPVPEGPSSLYSRAVTALADGTTITDPAGDWSPSGFADVRDPFVHIPWIDMRSYTIGADTEYLYFKAVVGGNFPATLAEREVYDGDPVKAGGGILEIYKNKQNPSLFMEDAVFWFGIDSAADHINGPGCFYWTDPTGVSYPENTEVQWSTQHRDDYYWGGLGKNWTIRAIPLAGLGLAKGQTVYVNGHTEAGLASAQNVHASVDTLNISQWGKEDPANTYDPSGIPIVLGEKATISLP